MTKRLIDVDDELIERARSALGTVTLKETVNRALTEAVRLERARRVTAEDLMRVGKLIEDLADPDFRPQAWG